MNTLTNYSHMTISELIRCAESEGNPLALALVDHIEAGSDGVAALVSALVELKTNMETALNNISEAILETSFNVDIPDDHMLNIAQAWPVAMLDSKEAQYLSTELNNSIECPSVFCDVPDFDFENPFQSRLDAYAEKIAAIKKAEKERRAELRINEPLSARKTTRKKKVAA